VPAAGRRDWEQFHNLRTLSTSIALEAAELMEHTQWATDADLPAIATERREAIAAEVADVAIILILPRPPSRGTSPTPARRPRQANMDMDMEEAVRGKLVRNAEKYPMEKARGVATKYDLL